MKLLRLFVLSLVVFGPFIGCGGAPPQPTPEEALKQMEETKVTPGEPPASGIKPDGVPKD